MKKQTFEKFRSKILNISINKITNKFEPKFEKKWDSINNIKILLEIEQKYLDLYWDNKKH